MSYSISKKQKLYKVRIFQLQSMSNALRCIDQRFAFKNSGSSCLALILNLSNLQMTILHTQKEVPGSKIQLHLGIHHFFSLLIQTHGLVVKVSSRKLGDLGSISAGCWNSLQPLCHFVWHWACHCTDTSAFILLHTYASEPQWRVLDFCWSLSDLLELRRDWIVQVWLKTFKYRRAEGSETTKTPSTLQACSFFRILSWNIASQHQLFPPSSCSTCLSKHLTHWLGKFQSLTLEPEILWRRWFAWAFCKHFFLLLCHFHMNLNM